jgi:hypothetical protein
LQVEKRQIVRVDGKSLDGFVAGRDRVHGMTVEPQHVGHAFGEGAIVIDEKDVSLGRLLEIRRVHVSAILGWGIEN